MSDLEDDQKDAAEQKSLDEAVLRESRKHTRRSFVVAAAGAAAGWGLYQWLDRSPLLSMQPAPQRRVFEANARLSRTIFDDRALAPTYSVKRAEELRVNGVYGLKEELVPESWRLQLTGVADAKSFPQYVTDVTAWEYQYSTAKTKEDQGHDTKVAPGADTAEKMAPASMVAGEKVFQERAGRMPRGREEAGASRSTLAAGTPGLLLTMDDVLKLPKHELVTQFKCIEGWSQIVHWGGVRMADLIAAYPPEKRPDGSLPRYVYMETPNGDYYVGYDMHVCLHPQTLLVTEMSGIPLTQFHGAPLRLHAPTKYGYKQIKRIGLIAYSDQQPDDYWTKLGYDWYAGL
jgi:DMSO/TMAO reductase YedYZ molybdopterin-dependent catalytic subunit